MRPGGAGTVEVAGGRIVKDIPVPEAGSRLPSVTGRAVYTVEEVVPGDRVVLTGPDRKQPSVLCWDDIGLVYAAACAGRSITPTTVDEILDEPNYRDSSTMYALVLAMVYPNRVQE